MSSLDKLGIQGIRSFGPDEMARINFYSPLTLILGQNGCGKTTIIESLKFVTTGQTPPGCGQGAAFVHDPKMTGETIVKAQIKLRFRSTKGQIITGCRSVETAQKRKRLEFNTLESTLEYQTPEGRKRVSSKCVDFYMEMTALLGVTKPILDNVIFCHQEDSNWPLDDGKKVKDRFDAIFNATKYIKCLDAMRKLHKEKTQSAKTLQVRLKDRSGAREIAIRTRRELDEKQTELETEMEKRDAMVSEQIPLRREIDSLTQKLVKMNSIRESIERKEHDLTSIRKTQNEFRSLQTEEYTCSDAELDRQISGFKGDLKVKEHRNEALKNSFEKASDEIEALKKKESRGLVTLGEKEAAQKTHFENIHNRNKRLKKVVTKHNIPEFRNQDDFDINESKDVLSCFEQILQGERQAMMRRKREYDGEEAGLQKEIDDLRSKELSLEHEIKSLTNQMDGNARSSHELRERLLANEDDLSSMDLEELAQSIEEIGRKIIGEKEKVDVPKLRTKIVSQREDKSKVERQVAEVKKKVARMNQMAEERSCYDMRTKDRKTRQQTVQQLMRRNEDDFASIFNGSVTIENIKNEFESKVHSIRMERTQKEEEKNVFEKRSAELKMQIENENVTLRKLENEIEGYQSKLEDICGRKDLQDAITKAKEEIDHLHKVVGDQESSLVLFRGFMEKIRGGEACPLCHRDFEEGSEEMLVEEIERKLRRLPGELSKHKKDLKAKDDLHHRLIQLQPQKDAADKSARELEAHRAKLRGLKKDLVDVSTDLDTTVDQFSVLVSDEEICSKLQPDVLSMDMHMRAIRKLSEEINTSEATLGTTDNDLSMDELLKLQSDLDLHLRNLQRQIEGDQQEIMDHESRLQRLNGRVLELSTKELDLKRKQQAVEKLKEELEKRKAEARVLKETKQAAADNIEPVRAQLHRKRDDKAAFRQRKDQLVDDDNKKMVEMEDERRSVRDFHQRTRAYVDEGHDDALENDKLKLATLQQQIVAQEGKKKALQEDMNRIVKELTMHKECKRSLDSEKMVRDKEVEAVGLESSIVLDKERLNDSDYEKVDSKLRYSKKEEDTLKIEVGTLRGAIDRTKKEVESKRRQLNDKNLRDAEKEYNNIIIEKKCTELACDDLNKYHKALETGVMRFHQEKMSSINRIIRELWRTTYRGNDIDYIEIKTDDMEARGADKRRSYDYRVVMMKSGAEMDMRVRCSSGQKVLASLIIRMALAETFSSNCGVLALDEPTTNLDRENIDSLAEALLDIVNKRSHQKNFQLIIITHDNEFLDTMKRADYIEHYYEVSRNERGLSVIKQHSTLK